MFPLHLTPEAKPQKTKIKIKQNQNQFISKITNLHNNYNYNIATDHIDKKGK